MARKRRLSYPTDNYPDTDIWEAYITHKLFWKKDVRENYIDRMLPQMFYDRRRRLLFFAMVQMRKKKKLFTLENMALEILSNSPEIKSFKTKHWIPDVTSSYIYDALLDNHEIPTDDSYIDTAFRIVVSAAFQRFVEDKTFDMLDVNRKGTPIDMNPIVAMAKGIVGVSNVLKSRKTQAGTDQIVDAAEYINEPEEYIRTLSQTLNSMIGGFTKGYVGSIGAKSGHTKSSFVTANAVQNILTGKVKRVDVISPEESAHTIWRRVFASICGIPTTAMRQKNVLINKEHINAVKNKLENKLIIHDRVRSYQHVIECMNDVDTDMIYVDHLQSIVYPGNGTFLQNMIGNIPGLINAQKDIAKKKKIPIVNLSQVNDKEIQRSDRLSKAPRYWDMYGSSVLYQAARELIMIWYPIKDYEDLDIAVGQEPPDPKKVILRVEKSSFSSTGKLNMVFEPDFNIFTDAKSSLTGKDYIAPEEKTIEQLNLI